jgi:hypothetical protein
MHQKETLPTMTRRLTWLLALAALIALAVAPVGVAGSKKGYKVSRGATTVTLDSAFAKTLADAGVTIKAGKPAKADAPLKFPITNGRAIVAVADGKITVKSASLKHVRGMTLTQGEKSLKLRNPWVSVTETGGKLTAQVNGKRLQVATVEGGDVALAVSGKRNRAVTVTGVTLKLTDAVAKALAAFFALPEGSVAADTPLGTAEVETRIVGKGPKGKPAKSGKPAKPAKPAKGKGKTR